MSVIQIRKAQREGARLVIGLAGVSGSGKTYTALQLAYGLTNGRADKVGFIDTENRRGSLYSDVLGDPFLIGDLHAPFSPQRYIDAIKAFSDAGVEVLVIDSLSHAWEGLGGCQDIANASRFPDWKNAKKEWKRMMDAILQSPCHVILCVRARDKMDFKDPKNPIPLGLQPIIEANAMFEMTASAMMHDMGRRQDILKVPAELSSIFTGQGYISADHGRRLRAWVDGAKQLDPAVEHARGALRLTCEEGLEAFKAAWNAQTPATRKALGTTFRDQCAASATAFDDQRKTAQAGGTEPDPAIGALNAAAASVAPAQAAPAPAPVATQPAPAAAPAAPAESQPADDDGEVF